MITLSPQEQKIINILDDMRPHCLASECFIKDDRARISALKKKGFYFAEAGNCHTPDHHHYAPLKLRQLVSIPLDYTPVTPKSAPETSIEHNPTNCPSFFKFELYCESCKEKLNPQKRLL